MYYSSVYKIFWGPKGRFARTPQTPLPTGLHPASNGEAERFVQTFKHSLKATKNDSGSLTMKLSRFLITYRTPSSTTGVSPAELFMKRPLRTRLDLLRPSIQILDPKLGVYTIQVQYAPLWYQVSTSHHL